MKKKTEYFMALFFFLKLKRNNHWIKIMQKTIKTTDSKQRGSNHSRVAKGTKILLVSKSYQPAWRLEESTVFDRFFPSISANLLSISSSYIYFCTNPFIFNDIRNNNHIFWLTKQLIHHIFWPTKTCFHHIFRPTTREIAYETPS